MGGIVSSRSDLKALEFRSPTERGEGWWRYLHRLEWVAIGLVVVILVLGYVVTAQNRQIGEANARASEGDRAISEIASMKQSLSLASDEIQRVSSVVVANKDLAVAWMTSVKVSCVESGVRTPEIPDLKE